jgi:ribosomal protein S27E
MIRPDPWEVRTMVTITCPWCDEDEALSLADFADPEASFTCLACGTAVALIEDTPAFLELAA